jgi:hypothetical protein
VGAAVATPYLQAGLLAKHPLGHARQPSLSTSPHSFLPIPSAWEPPLHFNISTITINITTSFFTCSGGVGAAAAF